jgi:murein DD-endopeptidase MepM/ murein hydrolase activator NlpD
MIPESGALTPTVTGPRAEERNPNAVAAKVQAMFMEVMIRAMEDSIGAEDGLFGGSASSEIYRGMFREHLAASLTGKIDSPLQEQFQQDLAREEAHLPEHHDYPGPTLPVSGVITSPMGWRRDPFTGAAKFHKGTDIAAAEGTSIQAVADGVVIESGVRGTYGNAVVIQTDDGRRMLYAHNQQNFVRVGDRVVRGDAIAAVGATGRATGPHVHFEVSE